MTVHFHPRILELIASRICHDLVSPVGAISNGVELMEELGDSASGEAVALIASSAQQASIRLKCFRLAYGAAGTDKNIGFKDVIDAFEPWVGAGNITAEFEEGLGLKFSMPPKGFLKTLLNLLLLMMECCRGEGAIRVSSLEGGKGVRVTVTGNNVGFREGVEDAFLGKVGDVESLDARTVHAYVTGRFAEHFSFTHTYRLQADASALEVDLVF